MKFRILLFALIIYTGSGKAFGQLNPWWLQQSEDSSELHRQQLADSIITFAQTLIGTPYVWGGSDPTGGFDCSGFVCYVFDRYGITLPRTSGEQFDAGIPVPFNQAMPGDIILFTGPESNGGNPGHVGIVISYDPVKGFCFIHTSSEESGGVRISYESEESYYFSRFLEIRRVI